MENLDEIKVVFTKTYLTARDIADTKEMLIENGIDKDKVGEVMKLIGVKLLNTSLINC